MQEMNTYGKYEPAQQVQSDCERESAHVENTVAAGPLPVDRALSLVAALSRAGTLHLASQESRILAEPFADSDVHQLKVKNRVEDYIPHILISRRLTAALGAGQWCLVRLREWYDAKTKTVYGSYVLIVRGVWVGDTVAGMEYHPDNARMDYSDALEGTRGIALRRIAAKSLSCGDQVWIPKGGPYTAPTRQAPLFPAEQHQAALPALTDERIMDVLSRGRQAASVGDLALSE